MASGITHILLMKNLQQILPVGTKPKLKLARTRDILNVGAIAPDLPYASIADSDFFLKTESELADKFHYENTNELPLKAFHYIQSIKSEKTLTEINFLFSFFNLSAKVFISGMLIEYLVSSSSLNPFVSSKSSNVTEVPSLPSVKLIKLYPTDLLLNALIIPS